MAKNEVENSKKEALTDFETKKKEVLTAICKVLVTKNQRYGNSALSPTKIFYKGNKSDAILIRLNDKMSRVQNSQELRKNDLYDIVGYLFLYRIGYNEVYAAKDGADFKTYLGDLYNVYMKSIVESTGNGLNIFTKANPYLMAADVAICKLSELTPDTAEMVAQVDELIKAIVLYFIDQNITNFDDLID